MKRTRRRSGHPQRVAEPREVLGLNLWAIVVIDGSGIRNSAVAEYREVERTVENARRAVENFQSADLSAFQRWEATHFGSLLTRLRELTTEMQRKEHILYLVEEEVYMTGCSKRRAYARVMDAMNRPPDENDDDIDSEGDDFFHDSDHARNDSDIGDDGGGERMFGATDLPDDFDIREFDALPKAQKAEFRKEYQMLSEMYHVMTGQRAPRLDVLLDAERRKHGIFRGRAEKATDIVEPESPAQRFKTLYRKLVRKLHPDGNHHHGPAELALWHDVQTAYQSGDLARLEAVAARYELSVADAVDSIPVGTIHDAIRDIKGALREVNRQVKSLRAHPAWKFSSKKPADRQRLLVSRRRELTEESADVERRLAHLTSTLDRLVEKQKPRAKR